MIIIIEKTDAMCSSPAKSIIKAITKKKQTDKTTRWGMACVDSTNSVIATINHLVIRLLKIPEL